MIDANRPQTVRADDVLEALRGRGFALEVADDHVVATRDATKLVVPAPGRTLPPTFVQRLEHAVRPVLGPDWLQLEEPPATTGPAVEPTDVLLLDAVVDQCPLSSEWCAFLPCDLTVMGFGAAREDALRDLKKAAALWVGLPVAQVVLITPEVV